jgi:hypothetical protein
MRVLAGSLPSSSSASGTLPFIGRLDLDGRGFIANIYGNQNSGKTESLRTAAAFGIPREDKLLRNWRGKLQRAPS